MTHFHDGPFDAKSDNFSAERVMMLFFGGRHDDCWKLRGMAFAEAAMAKQKH
jgi:hypothetical protein